MRSCCSACCDRYGLIWLARDRNAQTDDAEDRRGWERYLTEHAYKVDEQEYGDWARLLRFSAAGRSAEESTPRQALGEMVLQSVHLGIEGEAGSSQPGTRSTTARCRHARETPCKSACNGWPRRSRPPTTASSCSFWTVHRR